MGVEKQKKFLTVAPFKCVWCEELRFREAGRGCIAFEAFAQNDVTLVFRAQAGSQHYHYKMDNNPNYTIILGSHRNRRLKIEASGKTVVDVAGVGLCTSSAFQSYWISIYDGLISIGKGKYPFQNLIFEWLDSEPKFNVQYIGLSSWDKHVGYRNISILPMQSHNNAIWSHIDYKVYEGEDDECDVMEELNHSLEKQGLVNFLENWDLSDLMFVVGPERKVVPAHKVILCATGVFSELTDENVIELPLTSYPVLHAFLEFIYAGQTQISECELAPLWDLSVQFKVSELDKQCEEIMKGFEISNKILDSGNTVKITNLSSHIQQFSTFPHEVPLDVGKLKHFLDTGEHSDVNLHIEGHGLVAQSHKLVLSLWSSPFAKMFTNGMVETSSSDIYLKDISAEAFLVMLQFMYTGILDMDILETSPILILLLLLADQFGVTVLQQECCKRVIECLSEDIVCTVLQAVSSVQSYKLLEETCKRNFAMHFDYCTTASTDFVLFDEATFRDILQHPDMTVTSEDKVLDAILLWCTQACEVCGWATVDELMSSSTPEQSFGDRLRSLESLLRFVRFPLMSLLLLEKLADSSLSKHIPIFHQLVNEAITGVKLPELSHNVRFQHRRSSYKELQYICDGDRNGVIYFTGTSYGKHPWVNPVLAKKVTVTASSPASRYTDPKALVSRAYQATSFAGPRFEGGQSSSWWMVDIGENHQLMCNYYSVRQDGSSTYMRSWAFQGSMDGENWTNLRIHDDDQTICRSGQFASWPITGSMALLPFRFFRVILRGPSSGDANVWNFCICFIELYGYFI
ncbi:BTB/POZ domain-containing protein At2g30600-like [Zingiber officinale]|uniref:BTB/POZ domain-containing protein At2g30600-like n=1 Tax=Zingiber officinale TaxID=94328 RepID=UPI001C4C0BE3|nr:BTB/POZ domain-containing protein At2g30600-like [Zingiber officinale]XP_042448789.1 BTB/POZ domain-containing protein At2g30600-like [Zingiber officinale]XP_042448790.1 BTB/POZ domain-containing protein At2g30600-like [Zingiber officinale]XP_042448791.1 BTB/POZ domain-containing protein At2g30600-like [Zingiber officinale]XP_042448792.1 BTB/POZ domain-containing protein At2g30600-like [Zingiber officinale]XP_042448793.1 BTB/POZ domain-containing protein At2g30600-like [Zingiber officinale]